MRMWGILSINQLFYAFLVVEFYFWSLASSMRPRVDFLADLLTTCICKDYLK
jgi:hypothetical protein